MRGRGRSVMERWGQGSRERRTNYRCEIGETERETVIGKGNKHWEEMGNI